MKEQGKKGTHILILSVPIRSMRTPATHTPLQPSAPTPSTPLPLQPDLPSRLPSVLISIRSPIASRVPTFVPSIALRRRRRVRRISARIDVLPRLSHHRLLMSSRARIVLVVVEPSNEVHPLPLATLPLGLAWVVLAVVVLVVVGCSDPSACSDACADTGFLVEGGFGLGELVVVWVVVLVEVERLKAAVEAENGEEEGKGKKAQRVGRGQHE
jgi:hypothetical protein